MQQLDNIVDAAVNCTLQPARSYYAIIVVFRYPYI